MKLSLFYIANRVFKVLNSECLGFDKGVCPVKIQPLFYNIEIPNGEYQYCPIEDLVAIDLFIEYWGDEKVVENRVFLGDTIRSLIRRNENCYRLVFDFSSFICICYIENEKKILIKAEKCLIKNSFSTNMFLSTDKLKEYDNIWFQNRIKQFVYRYNVIYEKNNKHLKTHKDEIQPQLEYIEESLFDDTHDKLHDGGLLKYHQAGKPKKLAIKWNIGKSEYSAFFWFEEEPIREVFDKFYGAHPDTKTDFIIRIDAENKKYELALYRYGLKEPLIIAENVYQLLVFKNKFENYRSDNYNQERGAWIW